MKMPLLHRWPLAVVLGTFCFLVSARAQRFNFPPFKELPTVMIQATEPLATEPGKNPGVFTISAVGNSNAALTVAYSIGGTAKNGVDYSTVTNSVTLAAGQASTNILITPVAEASATGYKTVALALPRGAGAGSYYVGGLPSAEVYIVYDYTNVPPVVSLFSPTNGATFLSLPNIALRATASDSNGWITSVEFIGDGAGLGTVSNHPFGPGPVIPLVMREARGLVRPVLEWQNTQFMFVWTNVPVGAHSLKAIATDNAGLQTTSATVDITVTTNLPVPEIRIVSPFNGASFASNANVSLLAAAGETGGVINTVEFFNGKTSLGVVTNNGPSEPFDPFRSQVPWQPFFLLWTNAPVGSNVLTAVATDNNGSQAVSAPVGIEILTNSLRWHHWP